MSLGFQDSTVRARISLVFFGALSLAAWYTFPLALTASEHVRPRAAEYNVYQQIVPSRLSQPATVAFAWRSQREYYSVRLSRDATRVARTSAGKETVLAAGPSVVSAAKTKPRATLCVSRRLSFIDVTLDGRLLVRAYDDTWYEGKAGTRDPSGDIFVGAMRVQRISDFSFGEEFDSADTVASLWSRLGGQWEIEAPKDGLIARDGGPPMFSRYVASGSGLVAAGRPFWDNYHAEVTCKLHKGSAIGLAFNFRDDANYALVAMIPGSHRKPGRVELRIVERGKATVLAKHIGNYDYDRWYRLGIESHRGDVCVGVNGDRLISSSISFPLDGRVGLWVDGAERAYFDDVEVTRVRKFSGRVLDLRPYRPIVGKWRPGARSILGVSDSSFAAALARGPAWENCRAEVVLGRREGAASGLVFRWQDKSNFHFFTLSRDGRAWELGRIRRGKTDILRRGRLRRSARGKPVSLRVEAAGALIRCAVDGRQAVKTYDLPGASGRVGLFCRGGTAEFDGIEIEPFPPKAITIFSTKFEAPFVPGDEEKKDRMLIGDVLVPAGGIWALAARPSGTRLEASANEGPAACWFEGFCPGDTHARTQLAHLSPGAEAGVAIDASDGKEPGEPACAKTGYQLQIKREGGFVLRLRRDGAVVAERRLGPLPFPIDLALIRDGRFVVASLNGKPRLIYRDESPRRGGRGGMLVQAGTAEFATFTVGSGSALSYRFEHIEPDWYATSGKWTLHGGMTCIPWSHWITGRADETPEAKALLWNGRSVGGNITLEFYVSESTEGYATGNHRHFPYHDVTAVLCGNGEDVDSGYACIICRQGGNATQILRKGKVVAETHEYTIVMGRHCNSPRAMRVRLCKHGGVVQLWIDGALALQYEDPKPIGRGHTALGVRGCRANFRDVLIFYGRD